MRRLALAALVALLPSVASAQFATIGPTPPVTDNGDRLATTAWVNSLIANGLTLASGKIWIGSAGNVATPQTPSGDCTLSLSGVITCTQAAGNFQVIGNLTVGGSIIDGNGILATNIVAPATPAAGTTRIYVDSTTKTMSSKNDAGTVSNTVVASVAVANQFMTGISAAGVITRAQPAFTDLSGQGSCAQEPALTGGVTTSAGSCATTVITNANLTGPVTSVGNATTIGANQVSRANEAQGVARSVVGVAGNATANVADIQGATANTFLGVNAAGTGLAFQSTRQMMPFSSGTVVITQASTFFVAGGFANATETNVQALCPFGGTFKNMNVLSAAPAAGQTLAVTLRVNNADTAMTCTVTGAGTTCTDTTHTATCTTGQTWSIKFVTSATTGSLSFVAGGMEFDNP